MKYDTKTLIEVFEAFFFNNFQSTEQTEKKSNITLLECSYIKCKMLPNTVSKDANK